MEEGRRELGSIYSKYFLDYNVRMDMNIYHNKQKALLTVK